MSSKGEKKAKKNKRKVVGKGVNFTVAVRQTWKVCVDQRLEATENTSSALFLQTTKHIQNKEGKDYTASSGASRESNTREGEKRIRKRKVCEWRQRWFAAMGRREKTELQSTRGSERV